MVMNDSLSAILWAYLKKHRKLIFLALVSLGLFCLIYALYHLPFGPVLYAMTATLTVAFLLALPDFLRYCRKHRALSSLLAGIGATLGALPQPSDLLEEDYQALVSQLHQLRTQLISRADRQREEETCYYTLWAHQIKTPIAALRILLQSGEPRPELEQELFKIEQYVEMVLQYLRLGSMSSDLLIRRYPLDSLVRQAVKKYASVFIHKKLYCRLEELPLEVLTDEKWLVFVLEQLLSNALKYTRTGGVTIYLDPTRERTLVIEDTGIGIQSEDIPRIFERGFTGYNGRMDKRASGIGLSLCRRILTRLSHQLAITSQVGKGTRVFITFPTQQLEIE